jgi:hypothetical protein
MAYINSQGYMERRTNSKKGTGTKATKRNWWLIRNRGARKQFCIAIGKSGEIYFPIEYLGKRVRLKVEVVEDG